MKILFLIIFAALILGVVIWKTPERCPECGGTLWTWELGIGYCNRDGDQKVKHKIY